MEEQHKVLTTAEKTREKYKDYWSYANESIEELKKVINNNIKFNDDFKRITCITANNLKLIMENSTALADTKVLNKIITVNYNNNNNNKIDTNVNYIKQLMEKTDALIDEETLNKIINTSKKHNNNPDFIKEINRNKAVALKKDIQNTINNLLQHTVSFSKTTGKLYGKFNRINSISRYTIDNCYSNSNSIKNAKDFLINRVLNNFLLRLKVYR